MMSRKIKTAVALALCLSAAGSILPGQINLTTIKAEASTVDGIDSLEVCKGDSSTSLKLYKDSSFEDSTNFKRSISTYYVKLPSDETKFNVDVTTQDDYTAKIECDDDDYDSGDEISISKGDTLEAKVKIYDEDDDYVSTVRIEVKRLTEDDEAEESDKSSKKSSNTDTAASTGNTGNVASNGNTTTTAVNTVKSSYNNGQGVNEAEQNNTNKRDQWVQKGLYWQYYDSNGNILRNKWKETNGKWYYLQLNGYMTTGWRFIDKNWYYFDKTGAMVTGWFKDVNEKWYYFNSNGSMAVNTVVDGYRINAKGQMASV